jgi:hypothetical protein
MRQSSQTKAIAEATKSGIVCPRIGANALTNRPDGARGSGRPLRSNPARSNAQLA